MTHGDTEEHFHDDDSGFDAAGTVLGVEDLLGLEAFRQKSVGIDIGSSTSHLIFSELLLRREADSSRFKVTDRHVFYESPILLTPYVSGSLIDAEALQAFIDDTYEAAGVRPEDVDTGAVVITGEALKKENAQPIVELFSRRVGKFICASAGPNHEALLAAYGSGAIALSQENGWRLLNVDIGGGTTKLALIDSGQVVSTAAISIGARLIAFDADDRLIRIEGPARAILGREGRDLVLGGLAGEGVKTSLGQRMIECLFELILQRPPSSLTQSLMISEPLLGYEGLDSIDRLVFSGGVSEYVYGRDSIDYGDLGPYIGELISRQLEEFGALGKVARSPSGIRATVIGAGEYTVQASGNTCFISNPDVLPVYALQVVKAEPEDGEGLGASILRALGRFDRERYGEGLVLALSLGEELTYPYLRQVSEEIAGVVGSAEPQIGCLFLIVDKDVAKTIGSLLKAELDFAPDVIALDGIDLGNLDYVDIGRSMGPTEVVPVTVKSLVFPVHAEA